jgi:3-oxo-5-alpha-steroid 4-dehydrogenase 1
MNRTFIYSCLIRGGKRTPVHVLAMAFAFCSFNGYLQTAQHCRRSEAAAVMDGWTGQKMIGARARRTTLSLVCAGVALFVVGMAINIHSDHILRNLRRPGDTGYRVPMGTVRTRCARAHRHIQAVHSSTCPARTSSARLLSGRAMRWHRTLWPHTHSHCPPCSTLDHVRSHITGDTRISNPHSLCRWYQHKFANYPRHRRALIPFVL